MVGILGLVLADGRDDRPNYLSERDYAQLRMSLDRLLAEGKIRQVPVFNPQSSGSDEEWFLDVESGEIYSLLPMSERVDPIWERVDVFDTRDWKQKQLEWQARLGEIERAPGYLAPIRVGRKDTADLYFIRDVLQIYYRWESGESVASGIFAWPW
jgi:hypothetical protein